MRKPARTFILLLALCLPLGSFLACGGGGGGNSASDIGIVLTTQGSATTVDSGSSLVIRANVTNANNMEVTWSMTASVDPTCCGTLTRQSTDFALYEAPSAVLTPFTLTIKATCVENPAKTASVTLTVNARVCAPNAEKLNGQYTFLMQGFNANDGRGIAAVGSFLADGCGRIASGTADYFFGANVTGSAPLTGTYTVGTDGRGAVSLSVGATTLHFAVALGRFSGGIATKAAILETDAGSASDMILYGTLWMQDAASLAPAKITGPYAFLLNGWNGSGPRVAMGGTVNAGGNGTFTGGLADTMAFQGSPVVGTPWIGSFPAPTSAGRAVLTAPALTGATGSAVLYVADAGHLVAMVCDPAGAGRVLSGGLWAQTGPFGLGSLDTTCVTVQTANYTPTGYTSMTMSGMAIFTADGAGNLAASSVDQDYGANFTHWGGPQYTYTVASNGQATILSGGVSGGKWYFTGPNTGLMLGFDAGMSVGAILPQTGGPFSAASVSGTYFGIQQPGGAFYSENASGMATSSGDGSVARRLDLNTAGAVLTNQVVPGSFTFSADGRATDADNNVVYVISPDAFALMGTTTAYPVIQIFER